MVWARHRPRHNELLTMNNQPTTPRTVTITEAVVFLFVFAALFTIGGVGVWVCFTILPVWAKQVTR